MAQLDWYEATSQLLPSSALPRTPPTPATFLPLPASALHANGHDAPTHIHTEERIHAGSAGTMHSQSDASARAATASPSLSGHRHTLALLSPTSDGSRPVWSPSITVTMSAPVEHVVSKEVGVCEEEANRACALNSRTSRTPTLRAAYGCDASVCPTNSSSSSRCRASELTLGSVDAHDTAAAPVGKRYQLPHSRGFHARHHSPGSAAGVVHLNLIPLPSNEENGVPVYAPHYTHITPATSAALASLSSPLGLCVGAKSAGGYQATSSCACMTHESSCHVDSNHRAGCSSLSLVHDTPQEKTGNVCGSSEMITRNGAHDDDEERGTNTSTHRCHTGCVSDTHTDSMNCDTNTNNRSDSSSSSDRCREGISRDTNNPVTQRHSKERHDGDRHSHAQGYISATAPASPSPSPTTTTTTTSTMITTTLCTSPHTHDCVSHRSDCVVRMPLVMTQDCSTLAVLPPPALSVRQSATTTPSRRGASAQRVPCRTLRPDEFAECAICLEDNTAAAAAAQTGCVMTPVAATITSTAADACVVENHLCPPLAAAGAIARVSVGSWMRMQCAWEGREDGIALRMLLLLLIVVWVV